MLECGKMRNVAMRFKMYGIFLFQYFPMLQYSEFKVWQAPSCTQLLKASSMTIACKLELFVFFLPANSTWTHYNLTYAKLQVETSMAAVDSRRLLLLLLLILPQRRQRRRRQGRVRAIFRTMSMQGEYHSLLNKICLTDHQSFNRYFHLSPERFSLW